VVEAVVERLPERELVSPLDFVEESVYTSDSLALVVTAKDDDLLWESYLQGEKQADDLTALLAAVHVIAEEQVLEIATQDLLLLLLLVLICHFFEHMKQVAVLSVDVAKDLNRCLEVQKWLLVLEYFLRLL
jgi:hypothetical protein